MCILCNRGRPQPLRFPTQFPERRGSERASRRRALNLFAPRPARGADDDEPPPDIGRPGRRYLIRGGSVMSMDPPVGDFSAATC